ncbi:MAG: twin-arginine translocase subunit TatC [Pseudomonadota bacterium]|jgi:sec-independent protein translocase protein TatC
MQQQHFIEHLIELRKRVIYSLIGLITVLVILFPFSNSIYQVLARPLMKTFASNSQHLVAIDVISPFFIPMKLTALLAFILTLPHSLFQLWQFIAPALYRNERKLFSFVTISSFILFISGILFCYYLVLPTIFHFINNFKSSDITMMTDISHYLNFVLSLFFIFGLAFETPIIVFLLINLKIISLENIQKLRSYILVACFIVAAIVTPPDILSQTMLAIPLYLLYELGIILAKFFLINKQE